MRGVQSGRSPLRPPNLNIERGVGAQAFDRRGAAPARPQLCWSSTARMDQGTAPQSGKSRTPRNQKFGESPGPRGCVSQARRPKPPGAPKSLGPSLGPTRAEARGQAARARRGTTRPLKLSNRGVSPPRPPPPREPFPKGVQSEVHSSAVQKLNLDAEL